jgi:spore coat polysaccharide biosynthesis predicted glycosyltransferase SpsG
VGHGVTLAFDEGPGVGLGHRRRCEAIATALRSMGIAHSFAPLQNGVAVEGDAVVVDSYLVRADDRDRFRARHVIAIEDLERDLAVELLVVPDPGADGTRYERATRVLAGADFSLVDPALAELETPTIHETVTRVLVSCGASDAEGVGSRIATSLATARPGTLVRLVVGPWGMQAHDPLVTPVHAPDGLAAEIVDADLVVTAGGVTMLEACCLGRPTVAFAIAPNQTAAVAGAAHAGAVLAADASSAADLATRLARDFELRARLSEQARQLVDGQGAVRVASAIAELQGIHAR